ncbi:MAG: hypothetical protein CML55_11475 [Rhodobacteraceae bacterium]|nr:hypothetical protein [Paracoccaceae bacterium]MBO28543.1 hypothetical protein [Paracoccaceae bacterium]
MTNFTKFGATLAVSLLAFAPLAQAQQTAPAESEETMQDHGHKNGDMVGKDGMQGMAGMEGMEGMMPMMMKHMQECMKMMETMHTNMEDHHKPADKG